ncbi:MAG: DUF2339 domain-containing protein, partial [Oscillospiraceae bacterium]|nr:DUF2339 domain-containing protein [Oscillospiraceae bacterium]
LACIVAGLVFSYVLPKIRAICCVGIKTASVIAGFVSIIWLFVFNGFSGGITSGVFGNGEKALLLALYICTNLLSVFSVNDLLCFMVSGKALSSAAYPLLLSGYFVVSAILNLAVQLKLGASSMIITLIFGFAALGHIIYGFAKRNHVMRISGLCLSFFAVFKLFVFDLFYLSTELKIAAYFMLGVLLLAISFVYQYFNKKLNENLKNLEEKNDNNNKK